MRPPAWIRDQASRETCCVVVSIEELVDQTRQLIPHRHPDHRHHGSDRNGPRHGGKPSIRITYANSASTSQSSMAKISTTSCWCSTVLVSESDKTVTAAP